MLSQYDKAAAGAVGSALALVIGHFAKMDPAVTGALATVLTAALVWLVPNKSKPEEVA